ncbi:PIG-L deacetylase family protein [Kocuria rosea]|uniref:PIG-L deacetylase family protein n=1 Tax=Kocuria rosea TaxID=1275 RepID=UPI00253F86B1|nr:PIG-L family deacetylase [Kocuria rosea]WIG16336.1 PIG-L family deacetylase [Kocuria rosea]
MPVPARLEKSLNTNTPWLFLSPHLDDAVLSCAALMDSYAARRDISVATLFTEAELPPHTRATRAFLGQCSGDDAFALFEDRRSEDRIVLAELGVSHRHLGASDALFRQRRRLKAALGPLGRALPELFHLYPTYRFDIALGRISRADRSLIERLRNNVSQLVDQTEADLLFCPVGVGRHVDHLITRLVGSEFPEKVVYYSDFPYNQFADPESAFLQKHQLVAWNWDVDPVRKHHHISQYASQAPALFPDGDIPIAHETYFAAL